MRQFKHVVVGTLVGCLASLTLGSVSSVKATVVTCADVLDEWGIVQVDESDPTVEYVNPELWYDISSIDQLYCLGEGVYKADGEVAVNCANAPLSGLLQANFVLANDVDFNDLTVTGVANWRPIGSNGCQFTGVFDGNSKTIANLTYNLPFQANSTSTPYEAVGMFGSTGRDDPTLIKNVILTNVDFAGLQDVGGLIGIADKNTTVQNVSVEGELRVGQGGYGDLGGIIGWSNGEVSGPNVVEGAIVNVTLGVVASSDAGHLADEVWSAGGVVGWGTWTDISDVDSSITVNEEFLHGVGGIIGVAYEFTIADSSTMAYITAQDFLGGIVGEDHGSDILRVEAEVAISGGSYLGGVGGQLVDGSLIRSSANGAIIGETHIGGITGLGVREEIDNVMSWVDLTIDNTAGGLVGQIINSQISDSYSRGEMTSSTSTNVGGLVGLLQDAESDPDSSAIQSFWDAEISGQSSSPLGSGKTSAQMKSFSTYAAWDVVREISNAHVWGICDDVNDGYPFLQDFAFSGSCAPIISSGGGVPVVETKPAPPVMVAPSKPTISPSMVAAMTPAQIRALTLDLIRAMDDATLKSLSPKQVSRMTSDQLNALTGSQFSKLNPDAIGAIRPKILAMVRRALLKSMTNRQIKVLSDAQMDELPPKLVDTLLNR